MARFGSGTRRQVRRLRVAVADSGIPGPQASARQIGSPFPEIAMTPRLGMPLEARFVLPRELMRADAMMELEHEVGRLAPAPSVFNRHVEIAIDALGRTGRDTPVSLGG